MGERLRSLTREGRWDDLPAQISDEVLDTFSPTGRYDQIAEVLASAYGNLTDWITFPMPQAAGQDAEAAEAIARLRGGV